jgi:hypothetical protein
MLQFRIFQDRSQRPREDRDCSRGVWPPTGLGHFRRLRPMGTPQVMSLSACSQPGILIPGTLTLNHFPACLPPAPTGLGALPSGFLSCAKPTWDFEIHLFASGFPPWRFRPPLGLPTMGFAIHEARPPRGAPSPSENRRVSPSQSWYKPRLAPPQLYKPSLSHTVTRRPFEKYSFALAGFGRYWATTAID